MHRVGRLEIKVSYLSNALSPSFMSLQSLDIAAIAIIQIQVGRTPTVSSCAVRSSFHLKRWVKDGFPIYLLSVMQKKSPVVFQKSTGQSYLRVTCCPFLEQ